MKKTYTFILSFLMYLNISGQISFDPGYYLNNSGEKISGFIKNVDWKDNPTSFSFKKSINGSTSNIKMTEAQMFEIINSLQYIRAEVEMDEASDNVNNMDTKAASEFVERTVYLKVLVKGAASLYSYENLNLTRYFYQVGEEEITQLVYKRYKTNGKIATNNRFRQQLLNNLKCGGVANNIDRVVYKKGSLVKFFVKYNECENVPFEDFSKGPKRHGLAFSIRPGYNATSLRIRDAGNASSEIIDFGSHSGFRLGAELLYVLPYNRNKWGIFLEPTYQYYKSEAEVNNKTATIDYKSIEAHLGLRYFIFLNKKSKIFINAIGVIDLPMNSKFDFGTNQMLDITSGRNYAFGLGYQHGTKLSVEARYGGPRSLLSETFFWKSEYKMLSLIVGYNLF